MEMDVSDFNFCTDVSNYLPRNIKAEEEMMKIVSVKQGVSSKQTYENYCVNQLKTDVNGGGMAEQVSSFKPKNIDVGAVV